ncbi:hypothetical protein [Nonomuraea sp. NPDC049480]|uniref:hypothetical protein n=1 Tax=Nonomuraea sp. NPDC049480 TaxID=3364353 RepID=UPI003790931E
MTADRVAAQTKLSTRVSAEWRFWSKAANPSKRRVLPLLAVKISPELDGRNLAAAGHMRIPLRVQRQDGSPGLPLRTLTLEISYDDGRTWLPTPVHPSGRHGWAAETSHPFSARGKFVSLRVNAADIGGNGFSETVIRGLSDQVRPVRPRRALTGRGGAVRHVTCSRTTTGICRSVLRW